MSVIHIVDTDFNESIEYDINYSYTRTRLAKAIIQVYEKRNLNVGANLALAFNYFHWQYNEDIPIDDIIYMCEKDIPEYSKYADDVKKYLMLT